MNAVEIFALFWGSSDIANGIPNDFALLRENKTEGRMVRRDSFN